tara:strand:- start:104 stop:373 length:270 start_codon:yes stop_codon:yes gene_type:complete
MHEDTRHKTFEKKSELYQVGIDTIATMDYYTLCDSFENRPPMVVEKQEQDEIDMLLKEATTAHLKGMHEAFLEEKEEYDCGQCDYDCEF